MAGWQIDIPDLTYALLVVFYHGAELKYKLSYYIDEE